ARVTRPADHPSVFSKSAQKGRRRQVVRQRSAKPPPPVQIRAAPPPFALDRKRRVPTVAAEPRRWASWARASGGKPTLCASGELGWAGRGRVVHRLYLTAQLPQQASSHPRNNIKSSR